MNRRIDKKEDWRERGVITKQHKHQRGE
jgi:hypothetical protein